MLATERRYLRPPLDWMPKAWATAGDAPRPLSTKSGSLEILSPGMIEGACKLPGVTAVIAAFPPNDEPYNPPPLLTGWSV